MNLIKTYKLNDIIEQLEDLHNHGTKVGLKINFEKTNVMRINSRNNQQLIVNNKLIEQVKQF